MRCTKTITSWPVSLLFAFLPTLVPTPAAPTEVPDYSKYSEEFLKQELQESATDERAILVPMRDGVGLATNMFRPKDAKGPLPTILWKTPYDELGMQGGSVQRYAVAAVKRGYAFVVQNERGRYFSEGKYEILGYPQTDGYDALSWIAKQPWSNGKVGTLGCSSSAEWQLALAAQHHPAHAAMVPMSAGAGIGKVGRFQEQGNWYTGGVPRNVFFVWLYEVDNPLRAQIPSNLDPKIRARIARYNDLGVKKPDVDWNKQLRHLPVDTMLSELGEPPGTFEQLIGRTPADPAWRSGGLYHDNMGWGVPALWFDSWYDISIGPNIELFNHARTVNTDPRASANQYAVIAPVAHCQYRKLGPDTVVGERSMGNTSFDVDGTIFAWFDRWLKGEKNAFAASTPHVRYFTMGENAWKSSEQWPLQEARTVRMYLRSNGGANSLYGDGRLELTPPPSGERLDRYTYDPLNPVQTIGGGDCCTVGGIIPPGAFDQRTIESRADVLVYSSDPLTEPMEVTGFVDTVLKVSSSAKDTDFAVKLVDVLPDGTAYIIGDTIFRARYRNGFDKPEMMRAGEIYTIRPTPIATSIRFDKGHRIRVEVTSSNFPKFVRNLNTGGANESESQPVVANNAIHHSGDDASYVELPVVTNEPASYITPAAKTAAAAVSGEYMRGQITKFSGDEFEGRAPATPGDEKARRYLVEQLQDIGFAPAGPDNTWQQEFNVVGVKAQMPKQWSFKSRGKSASFKWWDQYIASSGVQSERVSIKDAEVVFVGYGIQAPEFGWDDFKGVDLKGKVLLVMNNNPDWDPNLFAGKKRLYYGRWSYKFEMAARLGAAGVIIIHTTPSAGYPFQVVQTSWGGEQVELPAEGEPRIQVKSWFTEDAARKLVALSGNDLDKLVALAKSKDFKPVPLGVTTSVDFRNTLKKSTTANVYGVLRGSDPKVADEYVIYTAHHDHLGVGAPDATGDRIYNGAMDNASGVAQLLAIGKAFKALPKNAQRRSVMLLFVAAEEEGLLGSQYYAQHPTVPAGRIAVDMNFDGGNIFGRTRDMVYVGKGRSSLDAVVDAVAHTQGRIVTAEQSADGGQFYRSDQFSFARIGVPSVYLHTGTDFIGNAAGWARQRQKEYEKHIHQPSDQIDDSWVFDGMVEDAQLGFLVGWVIANSDDFPHWIPRDEFEAARKAAVAAAKTQ